MKCLSSVVDAVVNGAVLGVFGAPGTGIRITMLEPVAADSCTARVINMLCEDVPPLKWIVEIVLPSPGSVITKLYVVPLKPGITGEPVGWIIIWAAFEWFMTVLSLNQSALKDMKLISRLLSGWPYPPERLAALVIFVAAEALAGGLKLPVLAVLPENIAMFETVS